MSLIQQITYTLRRS